MTHIKSDFMTYQPPIKNPSALNQLIRNEYRVAQTQIKLPSTLGGSVMGGGVAPGKQQQMFVVTPKSEKKKFKFSLYVFSCKRTFQNNVHK